MKQGDYEHQYGMVVGNRDMLDKDTMNISRDVRNQEKVSSIKDSRTLGFRNHDPMHIAHHQRHLKHDPGQRMQDIMNFI